MIQKAERIVEAYQKVKPAGCGVIAMDGRAAAGKTTLAEELAVTLGGAVVHMDDFFLPGELRTPERLAAPGGNVHAERFAEEVLPYLRRGEAFRYRRFDCHRMDYNGWTEIPPVPVIIVEGAYSQHPRFGGYADRRCSVISLRKNKSGALQPAMGKSTGWYFGSNGFRWRKSTWQSTISKKMPC